jgi:hypothetical protein
MKRESRTVDRSDQVDSLETARILARRHAHQHLLDHATIQRILAGHRLKCRQRHFLAVRTHARPTKRHLSATEHHLAGDGAGARCLSLHLTVWSPNSQTGVPVTGAVLDAVSRRCDPHSRSDKTFLRRLARETRGTKNSLSVVGYLKDSLTVRTAPVATKPSTDSHTAILRSAG